MFEYQRRRLPRALALRFGRAVRGRGAAHRSRLVARAAANARLHAEEGEELSPEAEARAAQVVESRGVAHESPPALDGQLPVEREADPGGEPREEVAARLRVGVRRRGERVEESRLIVNLPLHAAQRRVEDAEEAVCEIRARPSLLLFVN